MNKKQLEQQLNQSADKALLPPRKKDALNSLLDQYDTAVPQHSSTAVPELPSITKSVPPIEIEKSLPESDYRSASVPQHRSTGVIPESKFFKKPNEVSDQIDRELTPAESKVFDHLLRLSIGFNKDWCRVTIAGLQNRTGYRSDKTVRDAIKGLIAKERIAKDAETGNSPLGEIYYIKSFTAVPQYRSASADSTPVLESKITDHVKTIEKDNAQTDDEGARLLAKLKGIERELVGVENGDWGLIVDALIERARRISLRTPTITDLPKLLAEDLKRQEIRREAPKVSKPAQPQDNTQIIALIESLRLQGVSDEQDIIERVQESFAVSEAVIKSLIPSV